MMYIRMLGLLLAGSSFSVLADTGPLPVDVSGMDVERIVCASVERGGRINVDTYTAPSSDFRHWVAIYSYDGDPFMVKNRKGEEGKVTLEDFYLVDGAWKRLEYNEEMDLQSYAVEQFQTTAKDLFELGTCVMWTPPAGSVAQRDEGEQAK
jgi:hypothetical protein